VHRAVHGDHGAVTIAVVAGGGMALVLFVMLANLIVIQYGLGVIRGALDEGARAGALFGGRELTCEQVAGDVVGSLLAGSIGEDTEITCRRAGSLMVAHAEGTFRAWLPGPPGWRFSLTAGSAVERVP
jgi:hypothetical protein